MEEAEIMDDFCYLELSEVTTNFILIARFASTSIGWTDDITHPHDWRGSTWAKTSAFSRGCLEVR